MHVWLQLAKIILAVVWSLWCLLSDGGSGGGSDGCHIVCYLVSFLVYLRDKYKCSTTFGFEPSVYVLSSQTSFVLGNLQLPAEFTNQSSILLREHRQAKRGRRVSSVRPQMAPSAILPILFVKGGRYQLYHATVSLMFFYLHVVT